MEIPIKPGLHIANITFSGRVPGLNHLSIEARNNLIQNGWKLVNESRNPTLVKKYEGGGWASLFSSGKIIIFAVKSREQAKRTMEKVVEDCKIVNCIH